MQKKILILGLGAFGFAIAKYLGENNPDTIFFASEINNEIYTSILETRSHPYFFEGIKLPHNIELIENPADFLPEIDIIISVIPCQFVSDAFSEIQAYMKDGVTILNLSKGIDNESLLTVSEKLSQVLGEKKYSYAYLAGGMIAQELINRNTLGADIVCDDFDIGSELQSLFLGESLDIQLKIGNTKNTELYAACKNIIALILGFHEGRGEGASVRGYYFSKLLGEMQQIIIQLGGNEEIDFTDYALSGDLIATCFGNSRNRYLGILLGQGKSLSEALQELKQQNKIAEGYETLKGIYRITQDKAGFEEINSFGKKYIDVIPSI